MKKISVKILNKTTLELNEAAEAGDHIDLEEITSIDSSYIEQLISKEKGQAYQTQVEEKFRLQLSSEQQKWESGTEQLQLKLQSKENELQSALKNKELELENKYQQTIQQLQSELQSKEKEIQRTLENKELELKIKYQQTIQQLQSELQSKETEFQSTLKNKELELKSQYQEEQLLWQKEQERLKETYQSKENELQQEISRLQLNKSLSNVKQLGEELEKWCNQEFESYATNGFSYCTWEKDNTIIKEENEIKGTKADYIFKCFDTDWKNVLTSVCCEMKNEALNSANKKKNSDHYSKLDKDRQKKNCEYALLVSELEWDSPNDAPIKKVREYEKMYVVRPPYFIAFLSLISSLAEKYRLLLKQKQAETEIFQKSEDLKAEFEKIKKTYLEKPLEKLSEKVESIKKENENIVNASHRISGYLNDITNSYLSEIQNKIERFQITRIAKKLDDIS